MLRIAWFSDFSSNKEHFSKSAYFSELVLPLLQGENEIDCYGAEASTDGVVVDKGVLSWTEAMERHRKQQYDVFVYQVENFDKLGFIFKFLKQIPGVVIIHDLNCECFYDKDSELVNPQKNSLVPQITSDLDRFDLMNPHLSNFCLDPYLYSLIRVFTNPRAAVEYKNLCDKCAMMGERIEDTRTYVVSCLHAFANGGDDEIHKLAAEFLAVLRDNIIYLKNSLAKWEKYMFYRGSM